MTLVELLMAIAIMVMVVGVLGAVGKAVQTSAEYSYGHGDATQHARVALDRIARTVREATATELYPGAVVVYDQVGAYRFPDTLVVWHPTGAPANPAGPPLMKELVLYCPDPDDPRRFLEITAPTDARTVPLDDTLNTSAWRATLTTVKRATSSKRVLLTPLLRSANLEDGTTQRSVLQFVCDVRPSLAAIATVRAGAAAWNTMPWPQGIYSSRTGMRQVWVRTEMQLMPGDDSQRDDPLGQEAVPFFGSATLYYYLTK